MYVIGLRPKTKKPALLFGIAMHEALATWCITDGDIILAKETLLSTIETGREEYESEESWRLDLTRAPLLLDEWVKTYGLSDLEQYTVLGTELELTVPIGPADAGLVFTVRLDGVYKEKRTGNVYVVEHKTTGWGAEKIWQKTAGGDQITAQLWAVGKIHPEWGCRSVLVDVLYQRVQKGRVVGLPLCSRGAGPVYKTHHDLNVFELGMFGSIVEIAQKYKALSLYPWPVLFPLHKNHCSLYDCEYQDICAGEILPGQSMPGYEHDPRVSKEVDDRFSKLASSSLENIKVEFK